MGRQRNKAQAASDDSIIGTYDISTGQAEIIPDAFLDNGFVLNVNGVPSSHIVLGQPRNLDFEYMRWFAAAIEFFVDRHLDRERLRVTHLGGGACSMARYLADVYPASRHTVVERDARLCELVRECFDIPRSPTVKIRADDACDVIANAAPHSRDIVIRDVFSGHTTPSGLATVEFYRQARASLAPGGLFIANCGDKPSLELAKAEIAGLREVFNQVAVISDPTMLKGRRDGNVVLMATDRELPADNTPDSAKLMSVLLKGAVPAHYKDPAWTKAMSARS